MTLTEITNAANNFTDENFDSDVTIDFANQAIGKINAAIGSKLPFYENAVDEYEALDDYWSAIVVVPYVCWGIKMNDSSIQEAREFLYQFQEGLSELKKNKKSAIAELYQGDKFQTVYQIKPYKGRYR